MAKPDRLCAKMGAEMVSLIVCMLACGASCANLAEYLFAWLWQGDGRIFPVKKGTLRASHTLQALGSAR
jgi:hypothetical protein